MRSIYLRDPDGYVVELTAPASDSNATRPPGEARRVLDGWQRRKPELAAELVS